MKSLPLFALLLASFLSVELAATQSIAATDVVSQKSVVSKKSAAPAKSKRAKPNIILVMTDDQGYAQVGRHGHSWLKTPNLDKFHDNSVRMTRFLVSPTCSPTRAGLMTGRHPMENGVTHTIYERERLTVKATILPQVLKTVGYTTGIFGKWHLGDEDAHQPHNRGFDKTFIHGAGGIGQAYPCSCADAPGNKYFDPVIRHNGSFVKTKGYCTDLFFTAAMGWMRESQLAKKPFFAYITTNAPHGPFNAPKKNAKRFTDLGFAKNHAGFYGMIENIDENMGRLMQKLEEWKLLKNTIVIFMSDNGAAGVGAGVKNRVLGKTAAGKELRAYNAGMKGMKGTTNEGGCRVPFFVRWDGYLKPGRDIDRIATHLDLLPTLAEITGAKLPEKQVSGRSLFTLWKGEKKLWQDRYLFTHRGRWKKGAADNYKWQLFAVRNQRFRFVENKALYDMQKDPGEKVNVMAQHPDVVKKMKAAYGTWWDKARPLMVNEKAPMSKTKPFHEAYKKQAASKGGIPAWKVPSLK